MNFNIESGIYSVRRYTPSYITYLVNDILWGGSNYIEEFRNIDLDTVSPYLFNSKLLTAYNSLFDLYVDLQPPPEDYAILAAKNDNIDLFKLIIEYEEIDMDTFIYNVIDVVSGPKLVSYILSIYHNSIPLHRMVSRIMWTNNIESITQFVDYGLIPPESLIRTGDIELVKRYNLGNKVDIGLAFLSGNREMIQYIEENYELRSNTILYDITRMGNLSLVNRAIQHYNYNILNIGGAINSGSLNMVKFVDQYNENKYIYRNHDTTTNLLIFRYLERYRPTTVKDFKNFIIRGDRLGVEYLVNRVPIQILEELVSLASTLEILKLMLDRGVNVNRLNADNFIKLAELVREYGLI